MLEAKAKVRRRHARAIREFQKWTTAHPKAKLARKIEIFDVFCDGALLSDLLKRDGKPTRIK